MNRCGGDRGQINFDFAIGVSIVVVTIVLAFSFVPGVFGGVTEGRQQSDEVVADRIGANLVEGSLNDQNDPGQVETECLRALFDDSIAYCGFNAVSVVDNVGGDERFVNVSVERNGNLQCLNTGTGDIERYTGGSCLRLFGGDNPSGAEQVGTSRRAVSVDGTPVTIVVRVW